ncbi:MAG: DUF4386 domain-containing protein [Acidimicrobiales bacterium]
MASATTKPVAESTRTASPAGSRSPASASASPSAGGGPTPEGRAVRRTARLTGLLYLAIFVIAPFPFLIVPGLVVVDGDAAATAANVASSEGLFRAGLVAETLVVGIEIVVAGLLYGLLRPVNRSLSFAAAAARLAEAVVQAVNLFTGGLALLIVSGAAYLTVFEPDQLDALAALFLDLRVFLTMVWGVLFGFHLALLGYLVYRSGFWPRLLGALLGLASLGYLAQSYGHLLAPQHDGLFAVLVVLLAAPGELAFTVWLLWKGIDERRWTEKASAATATA